MGFPRQEDWSGLPFPSPGDLHDPGIKPKSPALAGDFFFFLFFFFVGFFFLIYLFIFGCARSLLLCGLFSSCSEWRLLFIVVLGFLTALAFRCGAWGLGCMGVSCCSSWALEYRFNSCGAQA